MNKREQKKYVRDLVKDVGNKLQENSDLWPEYWDGNELRELVVMAFENERTDWASDKRFKVVKDFVEKVASLKLI